MRFTVPVSRLHSHAITGIQHKSRRNGGDPITVSENARKRVNAIFAQMPTLPKDKTSRIIIAMRLCQEGVDIWTADKLAWASNEEREEMKEFACSFG